VNGTEMLQVAALVAGLVSPIVSGAAWWGAARTRIKNLEEHAKACQAARQLEEDKLHDRLTNVSNEFNYLRGRFNGHGG